MQSNKKSKSLSIALAKITESNAPIRQRLAEAYNFGLIHLDGYDFTDSNDQKTFNKISETLQKEEPGRMPTRAHRSAEKLTLDEASELASEIIEMCQRNATEVSR